MNTKAVAILLIAMVAVSQAGGPFCSLCVKIIDGVKKEYNNDFTNVTADQLAVSMNKQCDANTSGLEDSMCKSIVGQDKEKLLAALQAGKSSNDCCVEGSMC